MGNRGIYIEVEQGKLWDLGYTLDRRRYVLCEKLGTTFPLRARSPGSRNRILRMLEDRSTLWFRACWTISVLVYFQRKALFDLRASLYDAEISRHSTIPSSIASMSWMKRTCYGAFDLDTNLDTNLGLNIVFRDRAKSEVANSSRWRRIRPLASSPGNDLQIPDWERLSCCVECLACERD